MRFFASVMEALLTLIPPTMTVALLFWLFMISWPTLGAAAPSSSTVSAPTRSCAHTSKR